MSRARQKRPTTNAPQSRAQTAAKRVAGLTAREREVLIGVARGRKLAEIGAALGIRAKTVERHKSRLMAKLDIHDRATLVRYAIWIGLIPVWDEPRPAERGNHT